MRVALTHPRASDVGGVERQAHSVAVALLEAGHEVHYFCQRSDASVNPGIAIHRIANPVRPIHWFKVWWFDWACRRAIERAGPFDLVQGFGKTSRQDVYYDGSGCLADFQRYSIDSLRGGWRRALRRGGLHQRVVARIERSRYTPGNFRRILAISGMVRAQILDRYGLDPSDVETLYPGVDLERFRPDGASRRAVRDELGIAGDAPVLVFLGSDYRRKGLPTFLGALAGLPGACGLVIGNERAARVERYRAEARERGVAERVHFLGVRPDPQRYLAASDCLLFPTHFDAFGSAVLEALACGVPAVVSRQAGAAELVVEGKTGALLDDPNDSAAWAAATAPWLQPDLRAAAGRLARDEARQHPWTRHIRRVLEVYSELGACELRARELGAHPRG